MRWPVRLGTVYQAAIGSISAGGVGRAATAAGGSSIGGKADGARSGECATGGKRSPIYGRIPMDRRADARQGPVRSFRGRRAREARSAAGVEICAAALTRSRWVFGRARRPGPPTAHRQGGGGLRIVLEIASPPRIARPL